MNTAELAKLVGQSGTFRVPIRGADSTGFFIPIRVLDARYNFKRVDLKVEPQGGEGAAWVAHKFVTLNKN